MDQRLYTVLDGLPHYFRGQLMPLTPTGDGGTGTPASPAFLRLCPALPLIPRKVTSDLLICCFRTPVSSVSSQPAPRIRVSVARARPRCEPYTLQRRPKQCFGDNSLRLLTVNKNEPERASTVTGSGRRTELQDPKKKIQSQQPLLPGPTASR